MKLPIRWGWTCNSDWTGLGRAFKISIPVQRDVFLEGMIYRPEYKRIEIWGYEIPDKNIPPMYNDKQSPEGTSRNGRTPSDGGTRGTRESRQSKTVIE
jgi:hypothetical protein